MAAATKLKPASRQPATAAATPDRPTHVSCECRLTLSEAAVAEVHLAKLARMAARGVVFVDDADQDDLQAALRKITDSISQRATPWE